MRLRFNIIIGALFILAGLLLSSDYIIKFAKAISYSQPESQVVNLETKSEVVKEDQSVSNMSSLPTHISIPTVGISLDIESGYYNYSDKTWTLSDTKASFITVSSVPNTKTGNTYIYGHNRSNIFAKLYDASIGDRATVTNSVGKMFTYKLVKIQDVKPDDLSLLNYVGKPILTIQTCSGFWDQYRRLFIFDLESEN